VTDHLHVLFFKLFGHISGRASRYINPSFTEDGASNKYKSDIEKAMERVIQEFTEFSRGRDVINKSGNWDAVTTMLNGLPLA